MIVSKNAPVFGGVYKLAALEENGVMVPKIKISENEEKITNPGDKRLYRIYNNEDGKAIADLIALSEEEIREDQDLTIYHPMSKWKSKTLEAGTFEIRELLVPIFEKGKLVYNMPSLVGVRDYCARELETLWDEIKRFTNPQEYYVDLTEKLLDLKISMIQEKR